MPPFGLVGPTYQHPLSTVNSELCRNWIPERTSGGQAKAQLVYVKRPGLGAFGSAGVDRWRAGIEQNGRAFVVTGKKWGEINADGTVTDRSGVVVLADDGKPACCAANGDQGDQIIIIAGGLGYIYTLSTNTLAAIVDVDFPANAVSVVFIDGYFIVTKLDSTGFYLSAAYNGTSWATADVGEKSKTTDYITRVIVDQDEGKAWFIGRRKTEVWANDGSAAFPLAPIDLIIPFGGAATFSWTNLGGGIYGLGQSEDGGRVVVRYQGYNYERISHHAMEAAIQDYSEVAIANAQGFGLEWHGHRFYILTFVEAGVTWVYDESTDLWTNWDHWNDGVSEAFLGVGHMFVFGKHLMGSHDDGTIYDFSSAYLDDDGDVIRRERRAPYVHKSGKRVRHDVLTIGFQMGVGIAVGQGEAPVALVSWSDDQGKNFVVEREVSLGAMGDNGAVAQLRRLGVSGYHGRVYRVVVTDPVIDGIADEDLVTGRAA